LVLLDFAVIFFYRNVAKVIRKGRNAFFVKTCGFYVRKALCSLRLIFSFTAMSQWFYARVAMLFLLKPAVFMFAMLCDLCG
jgi:hypothetical protein